MKQPFENLTLEDVETLKRKPISVANAGDEVKYPFTQKDVENAVKHLQTL